jgi:hypothetical protein
MDVEDHFDIVIPDEDATRIRTVRQLIDYLMLRLSRAPSARHTAAATIHDELTATSAAPQNLSKNGQPSLR